MKKKNIILTILILAFVLALIVTAVIIHGMKKGATTSDEKATKRENNITTLITEVTEKTKTKGEGDFLTTDSSTTQQNNNKNNNNWKDTYLRFINEEKQNSSFTLTEFEYAFVSLKESSLPFLLVHDDWNMYLFYQNDGTILQALDSNGEPLGLSRMDTAYTKDGSLYLEGSCGAPKAFYLCQVIYDSSFSLKYLAEGYYTEDGDIVYHDDKGNDVSKEEYDNARAEAINNAQNVSFTK